MASCTLLRRSLWWLPVFVLFWINSVHGQSSVRLRGVDVNTGRVEIYYNYEWKRVCDNYFDLEDAKVVCRQLGYSVGDVTLRNGYFGSGTGSYLLMTCSGYESSVDSCLINDLTSTYDMYECSYAGVDCGAGISTTTYFPWWETVRLVNGQSPREGRVEIWYNGQWNTICDDDWTDEEAQVVCRQLGYDTDNVYPIGSAHYGSGSGSILQVQCDGWEYTLDSCSLSSGDFACGHYEDAGVRCGNLDTSSRVIGTMTFVGVALFLITICAIVAVVFVFNRKQSTTSPATGMQQMTTLTTASSRPAPASTMPMPAPVVPNVPV